MNLKNILKRIDEKKAYEVHAILDNQKVTYMLRLLLKEKRILLIAIRRNGELDLTHLRSKLDEVDELIKIFEEDLKYYETPTITNN